MREGGRGRPRWRATIIRGKDAAEHGAKPYFLGQPLVAFGVLHKRLEATLGERAPEFRRVCEDVLVASLQQDVGYGGPDLWACGNREQMCLRLCTGDFDKVVVAEPSRGGQDRLGNGDIVIPGEPAHDIDGRYGLARDAAGSASALDWILLDQVSENVVEHVDLLIVQPIGVRDEQVRNASQRVDALVF